MLGVIAVFLITLGLGQLASTYRQFRAASLVGASRWAGYSLGVGLIVVGAFLLPPSFYVLLWTLPAGVIAMLLLLLAGSFIMPPPHPDALFASEHPAHGGCQAVQIPDGDESVPGLLIFPAPPYAAAKGKQARSDWPDKKTEEGSGAAICIVHGAGDTKISFKWRLVRTLLAGGFTILTIDLPGHGDNRRRPLAYPDSLSAIPAALRFLRAQPGVKWVGLIGISLGGAMAIKALSAGHASSPVMEPDVALGRVESKLQPEPPGHTSSPAMEPNIALGDVESRLQPEPPPEGSTPPPVKLVDALVVLATPVDLNYNDGLFYREMWNTCYHAPLLSLLQEITVKQLRESWYSGGYRSRHNTAQLFQLLRPLDYIGHLGDIPILLVYSRADLVAPPDQAQAMRQAAPHADFIEAKKASHVALVLMPEILVQIADWLKKRLSNMSVHLA